MFDAWIYSELRQDSGGQNHFSSCFLRSELWAFFAWLILSKLPSILQWFYHYLYDFSKLTSWSQGAGPTWKIHSLKSALHSGVQGRLETMYFPSRPCTPSWPCISSTSENHLVIVFVSLIMKPYHILNCKVSFCIFLRMWQEGNTYIA